MWAIALFFLVWGLGSIILGIILPGELGQFGIIIGIFWLAVSAFLIYKFRKVEGKRDISAASTRESILNWFDSDEGIARTKQKRKLADKLKWLPVAAGIMLFAVFMAEMVREMQVLVRIQAPQAGMLLTFMIMLAFLLFPAAVVIVIGLKKYFWIGWVFSLWFLLVGLEFIPFHFSFTSVFSLLGAAILFLTPLIQKAGV